MAEARRLRMHRGCAKFVVGLALALGGWGLALPASTVAYIYWANQGAGNGMTIGRADLNGSNADQGAIQVSKGPCGVAVSGAYVYWASRGASAIGRAKITGTDVEPNFVTGVQEPCGVTVAGSHIYWASQKLGSAAIGRAELDGNSPEPNFITGLANVPCDVAVNGTNIYWSTYLTDSIGRADLNGMNVEKEFISGLNGPCGMALDASHIYWANQKTSAIGRAPLSGTGPEQKFVEGAEGGCGVAVDASHIYWANIFGGSVGRANLNGTGPEPKFIQGAEGPCGVAVDAFPLPTTMTLGCTPAPTTIQTLTSCTATVTGTGSEPAEPSGSVSFVASGVAGSFSPGSNCGLSAAAGNRSACALTFLPTTLGSLALTAGYGGDFTHAPSNAAFGLGVIPSNDFSFRKFKANRRKGTGKLTIKVPGPGGLVLRGHGLRRVSKKVQAAGSVALTVKPAGKTASRLESTGRVRLTAKVTFTPTGGAPNTKSKKLTLLG